MIRVGINGFSRIGKCVFLQLVKNPNFSITCINDLHIKIDQMENYLTYDITHGKFLDIKVTIINENTFQINHHVITLFSEKDMNKIDWDKNGCEYVIDTIEKDNDYIDCNSKYVVNTSQTNKNIKKIVYGVNELLYEGEKVISASSCTTNCISPLLKIFNEKYTIQDCNFTSIHSIKETEYVDDFLQKTFNTNYSILNNIIPSTTNVSSSIVEILPELKEKINGTSVYVPVSNCSFVDVYIQLEQKDVTLKDIIYLFTNHQLYKTLYDISRNNSISCNFLTSKTPTILDTNLSVDLGNGKFKLALWYDNEWSYSAQLIKTIESMFHYNNGLLKKKYFVENISMKNKGVVCRFDLDFDMNESNEVIDDFKITSAIPTITRIIQSNPKYIILTSHVRKTKRNSDNNSDYNSDNNSDNNSDMKYSLSVLIPVLEKLLDTPVHFLKSGLSEQTIEFLKIKPNGIYLLENLSFHEEEVEYEKGLKDDTILNIYRNLGDVFICDAFCDIHYKHLSIHGISTFNKPYGYGYIIQKEINTIHTIINKTNKTNKKVLAIIGGDKLEDKISLIETFQKINNYTMFIAGSMAKYYEPTSDNEIVMIDGHGYDLSSNILYEYIDDISNTELNICDIGCKSNIVLLDLISEADIIFWNGPLGFIEDEKYIHGTKNILDYLQALPMKKTIICDDKIVSMKNETKLLKKIDARKRKEYEKNVHYSTGCHALLKYLQNKIEEKNNLIGLEIFQR